MSSSGRRARELAHWHVLSTRARSFRWASAFLSAAQRRRVASLYAFCRTVDDLADARDVTPEAQQNLDRLEAALAAGPKGELLWPEDYLWFRELCLECGIEFQVVRDLLEGMISDLDVVRIQSDSELIRYCYQAAGTVGLMMCSVLGVRDPQALHRAVHLGIAMQLTNISRDVLEDAESSRVYLPAERLRAVGVAPEDLVEGHADARRVSLVVNDVLALAEGYYRSADEGMRFLPARPRWAILLASRLYRGIGRRLRRRHNSNPFVGRVVLPWFVKLALFVPTSVSWLRLSLRRSTRPTLPSPSASSRSILGG